MYGNLVSYQDQTLGFSIFRGHGNEEKPSKESEKEQSQW
jgi:hypothetical protein